jgi:2-polyprenyl-3-methyl-5-hydroxy-6-metoxy-1,4-benzoquinol methylase
MASSSSAEQRDEWESHWRAFYEASQVNPAGAYRLRILLRWLDRALGSASRVLDIGSGVGDLVTAASRRYPAASIRGIELSATGIAIASRRAPTAEFLQRDLVADGVPPRSWSSWAEVAVCSEVLEHVDEPTRLLSNARQFLAPTCRVLVTVPGGPMSAFDRHIGHRRHYTRRDLRALLTSAGFEVDRCCALGFPFFNLYRLLVVARGQKLVREAASGRTATGGTARVAGAVFRLLLRLNPPVRRGGWQLAAEARLDESVTAANRSDVH